MITARSTTGTSTVRHRAVDKAGNKSEATSYKTARVDKTPPTVSASRPAEPVNTNASTKITIKDKISGIRDVWTIVDQSSTMPADGDSRWVDKGAVSNISQTFSTNGNNYVHVWARDNAGNVTRKTFGPYKIDKQKPSGEFKPVSQKWTSGDVSVVFTPSDTGGSGVKRFRTKVSNGEWSAWTNGSSPKTIKLSENGEFTIQAEVEDNAGNSTIVTSGVYQVDKSKPKITANPSSRSWDSANVSVTLNYSDTGGSGLKSKQYSWSSSSTSPGSWNNYSSAVSKSDEGVWYLHAKAVDNAGNTTTEVFGPYNIDKTKPTVNANIGSRDWGNSNAVVTLTYADNLSGVSTKRYAWSTSIYTQFWSNYTGAVTQSSDGVWYLHRGYR